MEHLKFLENAREAAYCLLFNMGEFKGYAADLLRQTPAAICASIRREVRR